ncbi:MAG: MFS transporter [Chlamydiia bacterium]
MKNPWIPFLALISPNALVFLDQSILNVALPNIQQELGVSSTALQWTVNSYLLMIAVFVLLSGKIGDRVGLKKMMLLGLTGFIVSSAACGFAQNIWTLIIARGFQGLSAAIMTPAQTGLIGYIFPGNLRGRATGLIVSIGSIFMIAGPLIGGYLIEAADWRWIFWINLPTGILGIWLAYHLLPETPSVKSRIDLLGFAFFACAISGLTIFFMEAASWGWSSAATILCGAVTLLFLSLLFYREAKAKHPFLDISLFKYPVYGAINISISIIQFFAMIQVFRTIYLQEILEYTPFETGALICFSSFPILFIAPLAGYISDKTSPKFPVAIGFLILIFANFWFAFNSTPSLVVLCLALFGMGLGVPFIFTPSYSAAFASVPKAKTGSAMGMLFTLRMTSGTIGLALIHLFVSTVQDYYLPLEGVRIATILSFSYVHFALAFLLIIALAFIMLLHNSKNGPRITESFAEGWNPRQ